MKNRLLLESIAQIAIILFIVFNILFIALVSSAVGLALFPKFDLVEKLVCPVGMKIEVNTYHASWNEPGESAIEVNCVGTDGQRIRGRELSAIFCLLGVYFLICFLILFIPACVVSIVIVHVIFSVIKKSLEKRVSG
jgi:hypothetical protein